VSPGAGCDHPRRSEVTTYGYRLGAAFLPSSLRVELLCSQSALQELSFASLQYLVSH